MLKIKIVLNVFFIFLLVSVHECYAENYKLYSKYSRNIKYDLFFHKYSKQFFGFQFDWINFKAQAIAESKLDISAESYVGAKGIMQIMPRTFDEIKLRNKTIKGPVHDPKTNIRAGIWYDRSIWRKWSPKETVQDRINFMMASYNAGRGHIINAQKLCINNPELYGNPDSWECIKNTLHKITGHYSNETKTYVERIRGIRDMIRGETSND